ncbi:MAG: thiamine pyrophosphate-binding protein [Pseudomonadota bacterium]
MRGADLLVRMLADEGVTRIFALSGNQIMPVFDACIDADIEIIHTRHEAAAVYMAEAYAQFSGGLGVALVTAGAGIANSLGPVFTSKQSHTSVLLLSGDSPVSQDGRGAFQEMDQVAMTASLTKFSARPGNIAELAACTSDAIRLAKSGTPGPVHLALPFDVLNDITVSDDKPPITDTRSALPNLDEVEKQLQTAERPLLVLGPSHNETRAPGLAGKLRNRFSAPVITMESPRGLNDPALGDLRKVFGKADLVVVLGKAVDFTLGFGGQSSVNPEAGWIVVNDDGSEIARAEKNLSKRLINAVRYDAREVAEALADPSKLPLDSDDTGRKEWCNQVYQLLQARSYRMPDSGGTGPISSLQLCAAVQRQIAAIPDCIAISDGGEFGQWSQAVTAAGKRMINGISGAIGGGIGYAIGAKCAVPSSTVFMMMGDGTAGFHFIEFETAARYNIPFVAVIGNDLRWNAEHQIQLREYGKDRLVGCELSDARYDLAAAALGAHGEYVTDLGGLDAALKRAVDSGKPACVNVMIEGTPAPGPSSH